MKHAGPLIIAARSQAPGLERATELRRCRSCSFGPRASSLAHVHERAGRRAVRKTMTMSADDGHSLRCEWRAPSNGLISNHPAIGGAPPAPCVAHIDLNRRLMMLENSLHNLEF